MVEIAEGNFKKEIKEQRTQELKDNFENVLDKVKSKGDIKTTDQMQKDLEEHLTKNPKDALKLFMETKKRGQSDNYDNNVNLKQIFDISEKALGGAEKAINMAKTEELNTLLPNSDLITLKKYAKVFQKGDNVASNRFKNIKLEGNEKALADKMKEVDCGNFATPDDFVNKFKELNVSRTSQLHNKILRFPIAEFAKENKLDINKTDIMNNTKLLESFKNADGYRELQDMIDDNVINTRKNNISIDKKEERLTNLKINLGYLNNGDFGNLIQDKNTVKFNTSAANKTNLDGIIKIISERLNKNEFNTLSSATIPLGECLVKGDTRGFQGIIYGNNIDKIDGMLGKDTLKQTKEYLKNNT